MKRAFLAILAAALLSACNQPEAQKGTPKFKVGDQVVIGLYEVPGQVLETDCKSSPCKYVIRYLPPPSGEQRDFRKETFDEVELKLYVVR